jgi:hypothetical protein
MGVRRHAVDPFLNFAKLLFVADADFFFEPMMDFGFGKSPLSPDFSPWDLSSVSQFGDLFDVKMQVAGELFDIKIFGCHGLQSSRKWSV